VGTKLKIKKVNKGVTMKLNTMPRAGFTLLEIMIIVTLIGVLAAISIPTFLRARTTSQANVCINTLRQIESATQQWALELKKSPSSPVTEADVTPYMKKVRACPAGGKTFADSYTLTDVSTDPECQKAPLTHTLRP
jgi:prepilin-type N-terminal cleavage/methylation domain-containing protein